MRCNPTCQTKIGRKAASASFIRMSRVESSVEAMYYCTRRSNARKDPLDRRELGCFTLLHTCSTLGTSSRSVHGQIGLVPLAEYLTEGSNWIKVSGRKRTKGAPSPMPWPPKEAPARISSNEPLKNAVSSPTGHCMTTDLVPVSRYRRFRGTRLECSTREPVVLAHSQYPSRNLDVCEPRFGQL